jgi:hypothetical protein
MSLNEGEVIFRLLGDDFDPDRITSLVGINPTKIKRKKTTTSNFCSWEFSSGKIVNEYLDIYEISSKLVEELTPKSEKIADAVKEFNLTTILQIVLWITTDDSKSTPVIGFEKETISFLNKVNASIDIDTYRN